MSNPLFDKIYDTIIQGRNVLLHGPGGVGKSWVLRRVAHKLINEEHMKVGITATTGVAAVGLSDPDMMVIASTLHRFAGVGTAKIKTRSLINKVKNNFKAAKRWRSCDILIIDEVSMLGGDLFKKLNAIACDLRGSDKPFGGLQLIVSGDFLQLPPVKDQWIFETNEWENLNIRPFILETPYRYSDMKWFSLLLRVRKGKITDEDDLILRKRVHANKKLARILEKCKDMDPAEVIRPTMFFSRRNEVKNFNDRELSKLNGELIEFICRDSFTKMKGSPNEMDYIRLLDDDMPRSVAFKVGAQVMLKVNLDTENGLVNGSRGVVTEIIPNEAMIVKFLNGKKIRVDVFTRTLEDKYAVVSRTQIPFVLAFAMTIHKGQGSTLDYAVADLGPSIFAKGQAYVALSRCKNIQGLFISSYLSNSITADKTAVRYSAKLEKMAEDEEKGIVKHLPLLINNDSSSENDSDCYQDMTEFMREMNIKPTKNICKIIEDIRNFSEKKTIEEDVTFFYHKVIYEGKDYFFNNYTAAFDHWDKKTRDKALSIAAKIAKEM